MAMATKTKYERDIEQRLNADPAIQDLLRNLMARSARTRYFETKCGHLFQWSTERMGDGKYASAEQVPYGPGARTGKATRWKPTREVHHSTRTAAKTRALTLWRKHAADCRFCTEARAKADKRYEERQQRLQLDWYRRTGKWNETWGPEPATT